MSTFCVTSSIANQLSPRLSERWRVLETKTFGKANFSSDDPGGGAGLSTLGYQSAAMLSVVCVLTVSILDIIFVVGTTNFVRPVKNVSQGVVSLSMPETLVTAR